MTPGEFDCNLSFNPNCIWGPSFDQDLVEEFYTESPEGAPSCFSEPPISAPLDEAGIDTVLTFDQSAAFLRGLLGYGQVSLNHFSDLNTEADPERAEHIWQLLVNAGLIDNEGNIQQSFTRDAAVFSLALLAAEGAAELNLSRVEITAVYNVLRRSYTEITVSNAPRLINRINNILYHNSSNDLTNGTVTLVNQDDFVRDFLRLSLLSYNNSIRGLRPTDAAQPLEPGERTDETSEAMAELASSMLADEILPQRLLEAFRSGDFRLEVRFTQNRQGEFDSFRVVLQAGWYEEVVAEFRDNE
ncbi:MAG: hypothetical protein JW782_00235, partial [Candidatus Saganbacteria bacterium]|nr:hypothetical protein [Candidatus Saganbacteria bacterium]